MIAQQGARMSSLSAHHTTAPRALPRAVSVSPPSLPRGVATPLVGRDHETQVLVQLLDQARAGSCRFAFLSGEPGIGKTCLSLALRSEAKQLGCLTLHGSAAEFERELPFGLIVAALDEYLESLDPRVFSRLATEDVAELAGVFPALRSLAPGLGEPSTAAERFRAHRAVRKLMERTRRQAATRPLARRPSLGRRGHARIDRLSVPASSARCRDVGGDVQDRPT